ncbi:hypothetical protein AB0333_07320 [Citricoccus sp. NPDC079358]|uniref:hypothetical protein n=1 Tax=Citricoccus sp. NPDC079358 TaxID=3154653 RepID=UPI00344D88F5
MATWVAAALATGSVPLHAWMLVSHAHGPALTVLMAVMALWCWWCGVRAVRAIRVPGLPAGAPGPGGASLRHLWIMAQAMALLHVALLTGFPGSGAHLHGGEPPGVVPASGLGAPAGVVPASGLGAPAGVAPGSGPATQAGFGGVAEPLLWVVVLELAVCFACAVALRAGRLDATTTLSTATPPAQPACGHT